MCEVFAIWCHVLKKTQKIMVNFRSQVLILNVNVSKTKHINSTCCSFILSHWQIKWNTNLPVGHRGAVFETFFFLSYHLWKCSLWPAPSKILAYFFFFFYCFWNAFAVRCQFSHIFRQTLYFKLCHVAATRRLLGLLRHLTWFLNGRSRQRNTLVLLVLHIY